MRIIRVTRDRKLPCREINETLACQAITIKWEASDGRKEKSPYFLPLFIWRLTYTNSPYFPIISLPTLFFIQSPSARSVSDALLIIDSIHAAFICIWINKWAACQQTRGIDNIIHPWLVPWKTWALTTKIFPKEGAVKNKYWLHRRAPSFLRNRESAG